jgi:hypothetical protein
MATFIGLIMNSKCQQTLNILTALTLFLCLINQIHFSYVVDKWFIEQQSLGNLGFQVFECQEERRLDTITVCSKQIQARE